MQTATELTLRQVDLDFVKQNPFTLGTNGYLRYYLLRTAKAGMWEVASWRKENEVFEYGRGAYYGDIIKPDDVEIIFALPD